MQSLFLFGIDKTENEIVCKCISIFLHFTSLNTFTWMCAEAVYLLSKLSMSSNANFYLLRYYFIICYGVSFVIVAISVGAFASKFNVDSLCWLSPETGMIWTFVAPAACIALINTAILIYVVLTIYKRSGNMVGKSTGEKTTFKQLRKAAKGTAMLLPLMGTTWLIGPFAVSSDTTFVDYIFNVLNGCQGIFIFVIYGLLDNEINECFKKRFKKNRITTSTVTTQMT
ncbi:adhesion G protein-coupled receptor E2-like [Antedon mediterranea]|uniref:adhesion G protein-coupled receptor E2-like n=1 Tax=Antedon mediterranea TaxID=105859 RepID=UPI003AF86355